MVIINRLLSPIGASIVLQVYDEVVVEVAREYAAYAKDVVAACMKIAGGQVLKDIDCEVDAVVSTSWAEEDAIEI
jgi:DNA polymerase I-like protein with 3'-5' exonuclease and polymerase domains